MRRRDFDSAHEFTEDVSDCSMCMCGIPALTHDLAMTEQIARNASMAHHPAGGVDWSGLDEFLPPLVPMSSAVMADAQAQIAETDRDEAPEFGTADLTPHMESLRIIAAALATDLVEARPTIANLRLISNANGDWNLKFMNLENRLRGATAKLERVEALIATWHASPDMRTRAHADRLSEALDGRPRA